VGKVTQAPSNTTLEREWGRLRRGHLVQLLRSKDEPELSPLAIELLRVVVDTGELRASDLANELFVTKTSISRYVSEMIEAGLLVQRPDPSDGRAVLLSATPKGARELDVREARRRAVLNELCEGWPERDVMTLTTLLKRLNDRNQDRVRTCASTR